MSTTTPWPANQLQRIVKADDLRVAPFRDDGKTYGTPTWIWAVAFDDQLYVRGYSGQASRWYQAAVKQKAGRIVAAGQTLEVVFEPVGSELDDAVDTAYRAKYASSSYLQPMISERARRATIRISLRGE